MGKRGTEPKRDYVRHPRFGNKPIVSEFSFSQEDIEQAHWSYAGKQYFPYTAIPADIEKQNYSVLPRSIYVDIEVCCEGCNRLFIFFAKEQKYWFETLNFYVDADCRRCSDCRIKVREIKSLQMKYESLQKISIRTTEEATELKQVALELYQLGYIKNVSKIDQIKT